MATYTETIGLHQWEAQDSFLRSDFNQDFAKIDAAFVALDPRFDAAETARGWLEDAVARMGYEALQGRLAADAQGKTVPLGRGLVFDSLYSTSRVTLSGGLGPKNGGGVLLDTGAGLVSFEDHFGREDSFYIGSEDDRGPRSRTFTAAGNGVLESLTFTLSAGENSGVEVSVCQGSKVLWSERRDVGTEIGEYVFAPKLTLQKGITYTVRAGRTGVRLRLYFSAGGSYFGYRAACTPAQGTSGTIVTAAQTAEPFRTARVWVRHSGGTVTCELQRGTGSWQTLVRQGSRSTVDCRGTACTETEFRLSLGVRQGGAVRLRIGVQSTGDVTVYDCGMAMI